MSLALTQSEKDAKALQSARESQKHCEEVLCTDSQETAAATSEKFFQLLVQHLAQAFDARYAFVTECTDAVKSHVRTLAFWTHGRIGENVSYPLKDTPCENVVAGETCAYPESIQALFPLDQDLVKLAAEGYIGMPLHNTAGRVIGHMAVLHDQPLHPQPHQMALLATLAECAGAEFEREWARQALERFNREQGVLLDINQSINRHLNRDELFGALAHALKQIVPTERFGVELPIEGGAKLQGHILSNIAQGLAPTQPTVLPATGTACAWVMQTQQRYIAASSTDYRERFPVTFQVMSSAGQESLLALPLVSGGKSVAALFFMTSDKSAYERLRPVFLDQLAHVVAVALDNCLAHERLRAEGLAALAASEEQYRDLFEEAPIAYVYEGLDSKLLRCNRTALKSLGITADQVKDLYGRDFVPDTPDAQRRLKEAFASVNRGTDTSGVVLELRRHDNGKPLWMEWWSRPDPSGTYTRTMFIDITERVLLEQEKARLEAHNLYLQQEIQLTHNFEELVGSSSSLKRVLSNVERVAATDSTVLITGETGTGKELIARAIHNLSPRKDRALVKVNCAAIPTGLIESELFGHEKGAFTGALTKRIGRFELADKGTIFLDEIGELPLDIQVKLLRVLQEGEFERVGGAQTLKVNVRVIAATNRDLAQLAKAGQYRPDLYYRLNVFPMHLPPLREREDDLRKLAQYFVQKYANAQGKKIERIPERLWTALQRYHWPGNVRELQHVIERAVILTDGPELAAVDWLETPSTLAEGEQLPTLEQLERDHIVRALDHVNWKVSGDKGAAAILGLKPTTLEARMKKLGIQRNAKP
jgi:PAS domain S-box-containing protein